jgi:hypothetical protein
VRPLSMVSLIISVLSISASLLAAPIQVKYKEGVTHGFLILKAMDGSPIALGDSTEVVRGNEVISHLIYHFKDGSLQQEDLVFSQKSTFRLVTYHRIEKGPSFKNEEELSIDCRSGQVKVRSVDDKGKEKYENERMKLPTDLSNGLVLFLTKNISEDAPKTEVSFLVATPKPRIVKLQIYPAGQDPFTLMGTKREAVHYDIKVDIGGIAGLIAPLLGKQPPDSHIWISHGDAPTFVKSITLSYLGGPMWQTELLSPVWPEKAQDEKEEKKGEKEEKK